MNSITLHQKKALHAAQEAACQAFMQHKPITQITAQWVYHIDQIVLSLIEAQDLDLQSVCFIATGSYGRKELQLYSDIDLLIIVDSEATSVDRIDAFIQTCWDIGLLLSHQLTTVEALIELAKENVETISTLEDMRYLIGVRSLYESILFQTNPLHMWPIDEFLIAKRVELQRRHTKYADTSYNLEPNIKNGVGGLRDLQLVLLITKRHFGFEHPIALVRLGFLTTKEFEEFLTVLHYLWQIRFALHLIAKKPEDRLLFEYQKPLASLLGYEDLAGTLAIEQFMKAFFQHTQKARQLTELLMQALDDMILKTPVAAPEKINTHFQIIKNQIAPIKIKSLNTPDILMALFAEIAHRPELVGIDAKAVRHIRAHLDCIPNAKDAAPSIRATFLKIFEAPNGPYLALDLMNRYGLLTRYLDAFAEVSGQMQYDLYHVFTVDQHTLFVIQTIGEFLAPAHHNRFKTAHHLINKLPNKRVLYLAAFFHDIGKGRGGNHSEIGTEIAAQFALLHQLPKDETHLLCWLVKHHLLMSHTAQKQDIYDPIVVNDFSAKLPAPIYLDYLYLLTVADISATNPRLWNAWKDALLKELYEQTQKAIRTSTHLNEAEWVKKHQERALEALAPLSLDEEHNIITFWQTLKPGYFLHHTPESIAKQTRLLSSCNTPPCIIIMPHHTQSSTEIIIYSEQREDRFLLTTTLLSNHQINIQEAFISTLDNGFFLDIYIVLKEQTQCLLEASESEEICSLLTTAFTSHKSVRLNRRRLNREQTHFNIPTTVSFFDSKSTDKTELLLVTSDRPGLLAKMSRVFFIENVQLYSAKIATFGERVEDTFILCNQDHQCLTEDEKERLEDALIRELT